MKIDRRRRLWWVALAILLLAVAAFVTWAALPARPMPEALDALETGTRVEIATSPWLVFSPAGDEPATGLILYPGARVDPRAYAPLARDIAADGHLVAIVPMPLNFAFLAAGRASSVIAAFPQIEHWAVGGHSLGGAMAAQYAGQHPDAVDGLVLWAAYPAADNDLSGSSLAVASIYGTRDGLATEDEVLAARPLLPSDARWTAIEGGNHAQFGWYGDQSGDNAAALSREDQQEQIASATLQLLASLQGERD
jgi:dienelactone hydrolase